MTDLLAWRDANPLRRWRAKNKVSLSQAAMLMGVSKTTVCGWENGEYRPGWESTYSIANAMGMREHRLRSLWMKWLAEKAANEAA